MGRSLMGRTSPEKPNPGNGLVADMQTLQTSSCGNHGRKNFLQTSEKVKNVLIIEQIYGIVCEYYNITISEAQRNTRKREIVQVRQIAHYFCQLYTTKNHYIIAKEIGSKNYATVNHSCKTVRNLYNTNKQFQNDIDRIEKQIQKEIRKILRKEDELTKKEIQEIVQSEVFSFLLQNYPAARQKAKKYEQIEHMLL